MRLIPLGPEKTLREVPLKLTLRGRYGQIGEFLGEMAVVPFVASVRSLTIKKLEPAAGKLQADLALAVYLDHKATAP